MIGLADEVEVSVVPKKWPSFFSPTSKPGMTDVTMNVVCFTKDVTVSF